MSYYRGISSNRSRNRGGGYKQHVLVGGSKVLVVGSRFSWEVTGGSRRLMVKTVQRSSVSGQYASWACASWARISYGYASYGVYVSHGRVSHGHASYGYASHKRDCTESRYPRFQPA
jgi:hypothetical protein